MVIEQVTAEPFCRVLTDRILVLQALTHITCVDHVQAIPQQALGYVLKTNEPVPAQPEALSSYLGAANLVSTGEDFAHWSWALESGKVLSSASLNAMLTPVLNDYGYGIGIGELNGHPRISHRGSVAGFDSLFDYLPESQTTLVILSNLQVEGPNGGSTGTFALETDLEAMILDPKAVLIAEGGEINLPPTTLDRYAGRYVASDLTMNASLTIARDGSHLTVLAEQSGQKQPALQLRAQTPTLFYIAGDEAEIEFDPEAPEELALYILRTSTAMLFKRSLPTSSPIPAAPSLR